MRQLDKKLGKKPYPSSLVFVNGTYHPELSCPPENVVVLGLNEAMRSYGTFLRNRWAQLENATFHREGGFVSIPPKTAVATPLQVVSFIVGDTTPLHIMPRLHLYVGAGSTVQVVSRTEVLAEGDGQVDRVWDVAVEEGASLEWNHFDSHSHSFQSRGVFYATLKRNSRLKMVSVLDGAGLTNEDYRVILEREGAEADLNGLWRLEDGGENNTSVFLEHKAPLCRSSQLFKGVHNGRSRSNFEGKIVVREAAQQTEAHQINNNLLLSEDAHANSKPNLEIFADDVKVSHGATMGRLDEEHEHYLRTRGLAEEEVRRFLVRGFVEEVEEKLFYRC